MSRFLVIIMHCKYEVVTFLVFSLVSYQMYFSGSLDYLQFEVIYLRDVIQLRKMISQTISSTNYNRSTTDIDTWLKPEQLRLHICSVVSFVDMKSNYLYLLSVLRGKRQKLRHMKHNLMIFEKGEDRFNTRHVVVHIQPSSISIPTCKIYKGSDHVHHLSFSFVDVIHG